jgi:hypothetical protein
MGLRRNHRRTHFGNGRTGSLVWAVTSQSFRGQLVALETIGQPLADTDVNSSRDESGLCDTSDLAPIAPFTLSLVRTKAPNRN